jgi:hypothetical protein
MLRVRPVLVVLLLAARARATECGELRLAVAHFKAAATAEEAARRTKQANEAREALHAAQGKLAAACAPRHATILALPLGYLPVPSGNASKLSFDAGDRWRLNIITQAGAPSGIVFMDPVALDLPALHWESASLAKAPGEALLAVAVDAQLTVEEPVAGRGSWRIDLKGKPPLTIPMSQIRACAGGKGDAGAHLGRDTCQMLARVDPVPRPGAVPDRGRALLVGEWQYGWHTGFELGDVELSELPAGGPAPRLDLALPLSAPIPGIADGKKLEVTFEANRQERLEGVALKLGHECAADDGVCEGQRFDVEVWYDRIFGVPFLRTPPAAAAATRADGRVTDRLARPVAGQRVTLQSGGRKILTITDKFGDYRFDGLFGGEALIFAVGRKPTSKPLEESRTVSLGLGELKVPVLYVNKLIE